MRPSVALVLARLRSYAAVKTPVAHATVGWGTHPPSPSTLGRDRHARCDSGEGSAEYGGIHRPVTEPSGSLAEGFSAAVVPRAARCGAPRSRLTRISAGYSEIRRRDRAFCSPWWCRVDRQQDVMDVMGVYTSLMLCAHNTPPLLTHAGVSFSIRSVSSLMGFFASSFTRSIGVLPVPFCAVTSQPFSRSALTAKVFP